MRPGVLLVLPFLGSGRANDSSSSSDSSSSDGGGTSSSDDARVVPVDGGWQRFDFTRHSENDFRIDGHGYTQISITDAFCPGEAWNVYHDDRYVLTTPRVWEDNCTSWTDNPNVAFRNHTWSSTQFSLSGRVRLTLRLQSKPYEGGAAFIRADSHVQTCQEAVAPFRLISLPTGGHDRIGLFCARLGAAAAIVNEDKDLFAAAESLARCGAELAWIAGRATGGRPDKPDCYALDITRRSHPKVKKYDCHRKLPYLCM